MTTLYFKVANGFQTGNVIIDGTTGNISGLNNADLGNLATANYFSGNGSLLSGINASNLASGTIPSSILGNSTLYVGTTSIALNRSSGSQSLTGVNIDGSAGSATTAGTVTSNAQPNITSTGTLASLTVSGNITSGNVSGGNLVSANYLSGVLTTAAQPNITSVGTLASLGVTANITAGNISTTGQVISSGNITAPFFIGNVVGNISGTITVPGNDKSVLFNHSGNADASDNLQFNYTTNVLTVVGNITTSNANLGNLVTANYFSGSGNLLANIQGANVSGDVSGANHANIADVANSVAGGNVTGQVGNALVAGTVYSNAQPNITSVGTLASLSVTGNLSAGNIDTAGILNVTNTTQATGTGTGAAIILGGASVTKDLFVGGTIHAPNLAITNTTTLDVNVPLVYLDANTPYPYNYELGFYSRFYGDTPSSSNVYQHTGLTRDHASGKWYLFSNAAEPSGGTIDFANANLILDTLKLGGLDLTGNATISGNITTGNASLGNLATANYFSGNGSLLTSLTGGNVTGQVGYAAVANSVAGGNVTGQVGNALVAGTVYSNAQPNITSVGTLNGLTVTSTLDATGASNVSLGPVGNVHISGGTSGYILQTNGSGTLSWVAPPSTSSLVNGTSNVNIPSSGGNVNTSVGGTANVLVVTATGVNVAGYMNATGNITSGNASLGNLASANYFSGDGGLLSNIAGGNVTGQVGNALVAGTVYSNAQPNITSVGTLSSLSVTANVSAGNVLTDHLLYANGVAWDLQQAAGNTGEIQFNSSGDFGATTGLTWNTGTSTLTATNFSGNGAGLTHIAGGNVDGQVGNALVAGTVYSNAQPNITSVGTLTSVAVTGNATVGNVKLNGGILSNRANVSVSTNTIIDEFTPTTYRTAKYIISASSTNGYQSAEIILVHNGTNSYISIYGSVCSNSTADIVDFSSNIDGVSGNVTVYATGSSVTLNLVATYLKT